MVAVKYLFYGQYCSFKMGEAADLCLIIYYTNEESVIIKVIVITFKEKAVNNQNYE